MNIEKEYSGFIKRIHLGKYAYFIKLSETGYNPNFEILKKTISNFPICVIYGEEPLKNKKDISELYKGVQKISPETKFIIRTNGHIYPSGLTSLKNITFEVYLKLKKTGINYNDRIKEKVLKWFAKNESDFVVNIEEKEELDEIEQIRTEASIKSNLIFINIEKMKGGKIIEKMCFYKGYNIYVELQGGFTIE